MKQRVRLHILVRIAVCVAIALAVDQVLQFTLLGEGYFLGRRIAPYDPPLFAPAQYATLARIRAHLKDGTELATPFDFDPELGWCSRPGGGSGDFHFDWAGSRIARSPLARERTAGVKRIVAMGDSFTLGIEVGSQESWCAALADIVPDVEIANLGVGSYGIDQALLRWRRDGRPLQGDEVWLGILPSVSTRVATMYLPAMRHWSPSIAFKPRFTLGAGDALELDPCPTPTLDRLLELLSSQPAFLSAVGQGDVWVRRTPRAWAPYGTSLAHRFACTRLWLTLDEHRGREPEPWLLDKNGEVFRLMVAIPLAMKREVEAEHSRFRVLVFPDRDGLRELARSGRAYWRALEDGLRANDIEVIDFTDALRAAGGETNDALWAPEGHYSAAGNRVIAAALAAHLAESK